MCGETEVPDGRRSTLGTMALIGRSLKLLGALSGLLVVTIVVAYATFSTAVRGEYAKAAFGWWYCSAVPCAFTSSTRRSCGLGSRGNI